MNNNNPVHQFAGSGQPMENDIRSLCQQYMNYHVMAQMNDGTEFEGIIDGMDQNGVTMLVPEDIEVEQMGGGNMEVSPNQFGFDGYGRRRRFRRFRRRHFPFNIFRFIFPYPYYYPYPYYPGF